MKHIDKIFKEKLYNHEATVPDGMWEKIAPIAEEESGRAILWFWFAGLLALLIGGFGIYKMVSETTLPTDPSTLVQDKQITSQTTTDLVVDNSLTTDINSNILKENNRTKEVRESSTSVNKETELEVVSTKNETVKTKSNLLASTNKITKAKISPSKPSLSTEKLISTPVKTSSPEYVVSNTVKSITNIEGTPANLVITKSYINKEGSIIKQSNLSDKNAAEGPVYDVIINSEAKDLNAGALLRIIEPLENIPLPAFQKKLKKKTINSKF